ncbi:RDD family protein [Winogradskyella sp. 3972H.M.0a.05]|uniref:RDD family protein n=1 Tax=Winogradskyella sp. 3972H.M.0a.05 TaxID=2950277 RepID=UPI00339587AA
MNSIDKSIRVANYLIDYLIIFFCWFVVVFALQAFDIGISLFYLFVFVYYFAFEATTGKTIGKLFTNTKVVHLNGSKAGTFRIFLRSFWRIMPFDTISYLMGYELGLHDLMSSTKLKLE